MSKRSVIDLDHLTHPNVSDLTVTLTSPDGTSAVLASHPASGTGGGIVFETSANNFWGEDAKGTWTLTVTDSVAGNVGTVDGWTLTALGDAPTTPTTYVYTDEFATATGANRMVLTDASGNATINTAAVTTGSYLDLNPGAVDTIAGKSLQIATNTIIKNVWAGDGNDIIIANNFGDTIQGGRGNDTIVAGHGADNLYGGPGSDTFVFNSLTTALDVIHDFTAGQDTIDLHVLLTSIGYTGTNPIGDKWLNLVTDGAGGTDVQVDPHNGQSAVMIVDLLGVQTTALHSGTQFRRARGVSLDEPFARSCKKKIPAAGDRRGSRSRNQQLGNQVRRARTHRLLRHRGGGSPYGLRSGLPIFPRTHPPYCCGYRTPHRRANFASRSVNRRPI